MSALHWKIHWPTTLLALVALPLLLGLGRWQLHRAEEKRVALAAFESMRNAAPLDIAQLSQQPEQYARVRLKGHYDNAHNFLLDNRVLNGHFGYEILTAFIPATTSIAVLIDRGWIEGDPTRMQRPSIAPVEGDVEVVGSVYRDTARFHFVDNAHETKWPKLIQNLQMDDLQTQLGAPIFPFIVRLDAAMPGAYRTEWQVFANGFGPERHIAYAVTWFALAGALAVMWLVSNSNIAQLFKRNR
jgi:cytochrome oxidase assembly protein ShyY1